MNGWAVALLALTQATDAATTLLGLRLGATEVGLLPSLVLAAYGPWGLVVLKAALVVLFVAAPFARRWVLPAATLSAGAALLNVAQLALFAQWPT